MQELIPIEIFFYLFPSFSLFRLLALSLANILSSSYYRGIGVNKLLKQNTCFALSHDFVVSYLLEYVDM